MIKLLLADDHTLVREGFKHLFALTSNILVAAEATNGDEVLALLRRERFDLVLLDMTMPGIAGPELIAHIVALETPPHILVLSMHNEPQVARRALAAGAAGYLTKDNNPDVLLAAIRKVAAGGRYIEPALAEAMAFDNTAGSEQRPLHKSLSEREFQVFVLLAKGMSVGEIGQQLVISGKTVSTHKARLLEKMGFAGTADLVKYAIGHGLLE